MRIYWCDDLFYRQNGTVCILHDQSLQNGSNSKNNTSGKSVEFDPQPIWSFMETDNTASLILGR